MSVGRPAPPRGRMISVKRCGETTGPPIIRYFFLGTGREWSMWGFGAGNAKQDAADRKIRAEPRVAPKFSEDGATAHESSFGRITSGNDLLPGGQVITTWSCRNVAGGRCVPLYRLSGSHVSPPSSLHRFSFSHLPAAKTTHPMGYERAERETRPRRAEQVVLFYSGG